MVVKLTELIEIISVFLGVVESFFEQQTVLLLRVVLFYPFANQVGNHCH